MKKLYIIILALILALAMIVPMAIPVSADPPEDTKKPVSWVIGGSNGNKIMPHSISMSLVVKQLSNGDTVGHVESHVFSIKQTWNCDDFISSSFVGNTAEFVGNFYCKQTDEWDQRMWILVDGGEPGGVFNLDPGATWVDYMMIYQDWNGVSYDSFYFIPLCNGNVQVHVGD